MRTKPHFDDRRVGQESQYQKKKTVTGAVDVGKKKRNCDRRLIAVHQPPLGKAKRGSRGMKRGPREKDGTNTPWRLKPGTLS